MSAADHAIELALSQIQITKYIKVVSLTVLIYDYLLTLNLETNLIWKSDWGTGKIIYILARYTALVDTPLALWLALSPGISVETCGRFYVPSIWVAVVGIACAEGILFLRTSALYANDKKMSIFLISLWISIFTCAIVLNSFYLATVKFGPAPSPSFPGCFQISGSRLVYGYYLLLLVQRLIIAGLTVYHPLTRTGIPSTNCLLKTLYKDCLHYFPYFLIFAIGNVVLLARGPQRFVELLSPLQRAIMHSVLSTRVLLRARGAAIGEKEVSLTEIRFAAAATQDSTLYDHDDK